MKHHRLARRLEALEAERFPLESPVIVMDPQAYSVQAIDEAEAAWRKRNPGRGEPLIILCGMFNSEEEWNASLQNQQP